ncbi:MAG TPA: pyrimidine 5'-nucleotidase [Rhodocyclaceae bacterium]
MPGHSRLWVFDLDNTLHDASARIFPLINRAMREYIQRHLGLDEHGATHLRQDYWRRYGATLEGLVRHHGVDPAHFLFETHRIADLHAHVEVDPRLGATLAQLKGRKIVFSNGPAHYAQAVLGAMNLRHRFDRIYSIESVGFRAKPDPSSFRFVLREEKTRAADAIMVEDSIDNVRSAKRVGMKTVWVSSSGKPCRDADRIVASVHELPRIAASV